MRKNRNKGLSEEVIKRHRQDRKAKAQAESKYDPDQDINVILNKIFSDEDEEESVWSNRLERPKKRS